MAVELSVAAALRNAIALCEQPQDDQTHQILRVMLDDVEEDHAHWLEQRLGVIDRIGLES